MVPGPGMTDYDWLLYFFFLSSYHKGGERLQVDIITPLLIHIIHHTQNKNVKKLKLSQ